MTPIQFLTARTLPPDDTAPDPMELPRIRLACARIRNAIAVCRCGSVPWLVPCGAAMEEVSRC